MAKKLRISRGFYRYAMKRGVMSALDFEVGYHQIKKGCRSVFKKKLRTAFNRGNRTVTVSDKCIR